MKRLFLTLLLLWSLTGLLAGNAAAEANFEMALKRAQYLLNSTIPTDLEIERDSVSQDAYRDAVRRFLDNPRFYDVVLRYHEKLLGVGLPVDYLDEVIRSDIDNTSQKFAKIQCDFSDRDGRLKCEWASASDNSKISSCPVSWEQAASIFWYPGIVAWVCPSVYRSCGSDLSRCFISFNDSETARNAELGTTAAFDSRYAVVKSLAKQPAGIATAVVVANYPYTKILEPGLSAIDGAIAHFYRQKHHFDLEKLSINSDLLSIVESISLRDTRFRLVFTDGSYEHAGILSTFGWLRRYEKNRTRANQFYERMLCRKFTSELPRVFPQDPGNLRETPGCEGCHSTLDPLADFFKIWGEGGELYTGAKETGETYFSSIRGQYISEFASAIRNENAFATCAVENAFEWLIGRKFYQEEDELRAAFTKYFVARGFSFKELIYAISTHPLFVEGTREDATVGDPLEQPPLGEPPGGVTDAPCPDNSAYTDFTSDSTTYCEACHNAESEGRQDLTTKEQWSTWASQAVSMMASGNMPPGQQGPPFSGPVFEFKEKVRCWVEAGKP